MIKSMTFSSTLDGDRVQTSNISDVTCRIALDYRKRMWEENEAYYKYLYERYESLKKELEFFVSAITAICSAVTMILVIVAILVWM